MKSLLLRAGVAPVLLRPARPRTDRPRPIGAVQTVDAPPTAPDRSRAYRIAFAATVLGALVLRCIWAWRYDQTHAAPGGDAFYYHAQANELARGLGFIDPYQWSCFGLRAPSAAHPPLYSTYLAAFSFVGLTSTLAHRIATGLAGVLAVILLGDAGRRIGGRRLGLAVAILAAFAPMLWINDALLMSETVFAATCALVIWSAVRYWKSPTLPGAALLGLSIALAALARAEALVLLLALGVPLVLIATKQRRARALIGMVGATAVLLVPWMAYNMQRFENPELMSTGMGRLLVAANCHDAYYGPYTGSWDYSCMAGSNAGGPGIPKRAPVEQGAVLRAGAPSACAVVASGRIQEESVEDAELRKVAIPYAHHHVGRLLAAVVPARLGRTFEVYRPAQGVLYEQQVEQRGTWQPVAAQWTFYGLFVLAGIGAFTLRRRRVLLVPGVAMLVVALTSTLVGYGNVRFRISFDVALCLYGAIGLLALIDAARRRGRAPSVARPG